MGLDRWRHREDQPERDEAVGQLIEMLGGLIKRATKDKLRLAPFVGVGCPGLVRDDGTIERGGQNLPGDWEGSGFNLPRIIRESLPEIGGHPVTVVMHNDAVIQGLSEVPWMLDVDRWGILTIGTGLGNASFANRRAG